MNSQQSSNPVNRAAEPPAIGDRLVDDHAHLEQLFEQVVTEASGGDPGRLRSTWIAFERALQAHLESEETFILPGFAAQNPEQAKRILGEHQAIRATLVNLGIDLDLHCLRADRVAAFTDELRRHARNEEAVFYPWAARQLDPEAARVVAGSLRAAQEIGRAATALEEWHIDPQRSTLSFVLRHLVLLEIKGHFNRWGGTVWFDEDHPTRSRVETWIDLSSVDTGDAERDRQLCSPEFLDIAQFPQARYRSRSVDRFDGRSAVVRGMLNLHGHTVPIDLDVHLHAGAELPAMGRLWCNASGTVDRQRFGLRWNQDLDAGGLVVGDKIAISAEIEAVRVDGATSLAR